MDPEPGAASIFQPLISTGEAVRLYNSTKSSVGPFGPRVLNSLMTTSPGEAAFAEIIVAVSAPANNAARRNSKRKERAIAPK